MTGARPVQRNRLGLRIRADDWFDRGLRRDSRRSIISSVRVWPCGRASKRGGIPSQRSPLGRFLTLQNGKNSAPSRPPLSCRTSPPHGGRSSCHQCLADLATSPIGETPLPADLPHAGEMAGRPEGGNVEHPQMNITPGGQNPRFSTAFRPRLKFLSHDFKHLAQIAKETFIHPLSASRIIPASPSREPGAHRVSGRATVPGRSRGGNAAGNFHPRPGPVSRLPRTGRGHRGGPDDRARPPAGRWEGATLLLNRAPTQRPASRLPQKPDAKAGVEMERLAFSHIKGSEGEEPPCNQTIPQQGKRVNPSSMPCEIDRQD